MHLDYSDILAKAGEPTYWGPFGVPRYQDFEPTGLNVSANHAAKMRVLCQSCGREFLVVSVYSESAAFLEPPATDTIDPWDAAGSFHYGTPPRHDCAGDGNASLPLQILEFWKRVGLIEWTRDLDREFSLPTLERTVEAG